MTSQPSSLEHPVWMKSSYSSLIFISHQIHLQDLTSQNTDQLIVACDWLTWRRGLDLGYHCVHFDLGLINHAENHFDRADLFLKADSWVYNNNQDMTIFDDVSLGKMFTRETSLFAQSYLQLSEGMDWFCQTFEPKSVVLYDIRTEFGLIDDTIKLFLAKRSSKLIGAELINKVFSPPMSTKDYPFVRDYKVTTVLHPGKNLSSRVRNWLRFIYSVFVELLFRFRQISWQRDRRVLLLPTGLMLRGLLKYHDPGKGVSPMLIAERESKKLVDLITYWRQGAYLARMSTVSLNRHDRKKILQIKNILNHNLQTYLGNLDGAIGYYVANYIISGSRIDEMCLQIKRVSNFLVRYMPTRLVVSYTTNPGTRDFIESAYRKGIPVDFLPHGPTISKQTHDALNGDSHQSFMISRILGWGEQTRVILDRTETHSQFVKCGYPVFDILKDQKLEPTFGRNNALILPYVVETEGFLNFSSIIYTWLLTVAEAIHRGGFNNIRVKIHPGSMFNKSYYEKVFAYSNYEVEIIHDNSPLIDHLGWADIVTGPVHSGAFVETLMAGRKYYPFLIPPHANDENSLRGVTYFASVKDFSDALQKEYDIDVDSVLDYFCGTKEIESPSS
ncbi:MAG: hypothetical protein VX617_00815 [Pseudomonadota bacterium]|nr:hypothetical protein [Pseudomonadota bacterium]